MTMFTRLIKYIQTQPNFLEYLISINNLLNFHEVGNHNDIFLFASARGGSTWLGEIIASQPNIALIDEPLNKKRLLTARTQLDPDYKYIYSSQINKEALEKYFQDIFDNRITLHFPLSFWKDTFSFHPTRYVFKLINGKHLINWFEETFDSHIVYLLRHPIPTALSRINRGWYGINDRFKHILDDDVFLSYAPGNLVNYAQDKLFHGSMLEQFVTGWCLENYLPIVHLRQDEWIIITYEHMVIDPETTCRFLQRELSLPKLEKMLYKSSRLSRVGSAYSDMTHVMPEDKINIISKWKEYVTDEEEKKCFNILEEFNIDVYGESSLLPDMTALKGDRHTNHSGNEGNC